MGWLVWCLVVGGAEPSRELDAFVSQAVERYRLPALSIALVNREGLVWERHYGKATPRSVYRVGSVSKLFTDLAVMKLVEQGKVSLDAPLPKILPGWQMLDPRGKQITLRQLMAHRAGLVREPARGNYFDDRCDSLEETIQSLMKTRLIYEPGTRTKYSNAGIALVGYTLEQFTGQTFASLLREMLLEPLGMTASSFAPNEQTRQNLAPAVMWNYSGREFAAPTFELGSYPAGCMYSTVADQGRFLRMLVNKGRLDGKQVVAAKTLEEMWTPQFTKEKQGFGLGFVIGQLDGKRVVRHGGAIYGFSTDLVALPEEGLGVVVCSSRDCSNAVVSRIADTVLRTEIARRAKKPATNLAFARDLKAEECDALAGHYKAESGGFTWTARGGQLWHLGDKGGFVVPVKALGDELVLDGVVLQAGGFTRTAKGIRWNNIEYVHTPIHKPEPCPEKWRGLLGEYGPDHLPTVILERDGRLWAQVEWFFLYPLTRETDNVFAFDDQFGMYHGEKIVFQTDAGGRCQRIEMAGMVFERRQIPGEPGVFKIQPIQPLAKLREQAQKAKPPTEPGIRFGKPDLVELQTLDKTFQLEIRYATKENFLGEPIYAAPTAKLQRPAAEALVRVNAALAKEGYGLRIYDAYRPWWVTHLFWHATPPPLRKFVADPANGSRHNRGCAVDVTLYERKTGKAVEMPSGYDEFSDRSSPSYEGGTSLQRWHRDLLRRAMQQQGFSVYEAEWWHYDYKDWKKYPIGNEG